MTEILDDDSAAAAAPSPFAQALRQKIGWLCQLIRGMAVVWALWVLYLVVSTWSDRHRALATYGKIFKFDPADVSDLNYYAAFGIQLFDWSLVATIAFVLWRLFSRYLAGDIFSLAAALGLRRLALVGVAAKVADILTRPAIFTLLTPDHGAGDRYAWLFQPHDLLDMIFITFLFSLAYIFKTATELAEEHAQIV